MPPTASAVPALETVPFALPYAGRQLIGERLAPATPRRELLILHGAGQARRSHHAGLRACLAADGVASTAFDFVGHGETGGALAGSSLASRVEQASQVAAMLPDGPLALLGSSMGAYVALRLLERVDCSHLALVVPGVYTPQAFEVPFGPAFSALLRQPSSWHDSDAWERLVAFRGHLLIVMAEQDEVIPAEIPQRLLDAAVNAASRTVHVVPAAPHRLSGFFSEQPVAADAFHAEMRRLLRREAV
ncbi:alpha/beta fold hydrolase [Pseudogulbenkiania subflava]|uniref:Serine aminopeptidase S33 domain-containing protein n=1 Tax=Pseudogulbenkiania subflava DSM 22618 TaxID=1123014 RepID=A0A1Y6B7J8_9NEIS|nr:alpha/beta fold hydrolase [Pseudogulbenkiania subflava]SME92732.1 hypothetical protein SAMN02745746_00102 [Pseudogulbenkiania subflava DSM 22618]